MGKERAIPGIFQELGTHCLCKFFDERRDNIWKRGEPPDEFQDIHAYLTRADEDCHKRTGDDENEQTKKPGNTITDEAP